MLEVEVLWNIRHHLNQEHFSSHNQMSKSAAMSRAIHAMIFCIFFTKLSIQKNFEAYNDNDTSGNKNGNNKQQGSMMEERSPSFTQGLYSFKICPMSIRLCYLYLYWHFLTFHSGMLCYKVFHKNYNYITMSVRKIRSLYKLFSFVQVFIT